MALLKTKEKRIKKKILLVDDHPLLREGLTKLINTQKDLEVIGEAEDVQGALKEIAEGHPDIVIVDLTLEDSSGLRLIEDIDYSNTGLPVLVLSMHDESVYAERCFKAGAKGYIMKKEPPGVVISALRKVLNGNIFLSDKLGAKLLNKMIAGKSEVVKTPIELLSTRELEIYQLMGKGLKKSAIAEQLNLSNKTVENYIERLKKKMNLKSTREVIVHAAHSSMK